MSLKASIDRITNDALSRLNLRAGNGMSLSWGDNHQPVLSRRNTASSDEAFEPHGFPRHGSPLRRNSDFLCNLVPVREISDDLSEFVPLSNIKVYVAVKLNPVSYKITSMPDLYGISYAEVTSLSTVPVANGSIMKNVNASVDSSDGTAKEGTYYFYYALLFSNGTVMGFEGAQSNSDIDYFYTNLSGIGWLQFPVGTHYPPIDLV